MRLQSAIFDMDGTLLDSNGIWLDIDIEFLGRRGISPVPEDYTDYVTHHSAPDAARYTRERFSLPETPEEIMEGWMSMARSAYAHTLPLKPGVPAFLDACRRRGTRMAVLTSCMPPLCRAALEHHRLLDCFEAVYTTAELGIEKRDPALYCLAAERSGVPPQSCLLFEDSPSYCAAARQAGFTVVGVFDPLFAPRWGEMEALCHHRLERFADASPTLWQIP